MSEYVYTPGFLVLGDIYENNKYENSFNDDYLYVQFRKCMGVIFKIKWIKYNF